MATDAAIAANQKLPAYRAMQMRFVILRELGLLSEGTGHATIVVITYHTWGL